MRQVGRSLNDLDLESTALQNLGVQEVIATNYKAAGQLLRDALELKLELDDHYGGLQILLNLVNVMTGQERLEEADALLGDLDQMIREARLPELRVSVAGQRAQLLINAGELDSARQFLLESLRIARRARLPDRELTALRNLARLDHDRGSKRQSLAWARKAQAAAESLGDSLQEEIMRRAVGHALFELGEVDEAVLQFVAAAEIAEDIGDASSHAESLGNAAACLTKSGRPSDAIKMLDVVLRTRAKTDDASRARQLANLAGAYGEAGDAGRAIDVLERAARLTPDWTDEAAFLRQAAHIALDDVKEAPRTADLLKAELAVRRKHQRGHEWAWAAAEMGATLSHTSQATHARPFFTAALRVFSATRDLQRAFAVRNDRAIAAAELGDLRAARVDLRHSLRAARRLRDRALERQALLNLSEIERQAGKQETAQRHAEDGLRLARESDDPAEEADALLQIGLLKSDQGDLDAAERTLKEAIRAARSIANASTQAHGHKHLAHVAFLRGHFAKAAATYRRALALMPADEVGAQRAEALGGAIMADAKRGNADESLVQEFVDVSQAIGWERNAGEELVAAADSLLRKQQAGRSAEFLALSIVMELRLDQNDDDTVQKVVERLGHLVSLASVTQQQPAFARTLRKELRRHLSADTFDPLITTAVEVAREHRATK